MMHASVSYKQSYLIRALAIIFVFLAAAGVRASDETAPGRDAKQAVDEAYTAKIKKYTTEPFFT
jgi:predicted outer membrane protein